MSVTWRMQRMLCENDWAGLQKEGYENEHPSCSIARAIPCDSDVVGPGNPFGVAFHAGDTHSASLCGFCFLTSFLVSECESCMWQPGIWKDDASAPGSVSSLPEQNNECRVSRSCEYSVLSIVTFPFYSGILSNAFWLLLQWHGIIQKLTSLPVQYCWYLTFPVEKQKNVYHRSWGLLSSRIYPVLVTSVTATPGLCCIFLFRQLMCSYCECFTNIGKKKT